MKSPLYHQNLNMEKEILSKIRLYDLLSRLESGPGEYLSLYMRTSSLPYCANGPSLRPQYQTYVHEIKESINIKVVAQAVERYNTGIAIYWQENGNKHMVLPPFPITEDRTSLGKLDASALLEALEREYTIGVVLVTWGTYSIGVFHGDNLAKSKTGTGYIHKEHRKGGRSQKRFARRTEEQRRSFLRRVSNRIEEEFENYKLDYMFLGGNRLIRAPLLRECKYLQRENQIISQRALNFRYADTEALSHSLKEITSSLVFTF